MKRHGKTVLLVILILALFYPAAYAADDNGPLGPSDDAAVEVFLRGMIDTALKPGTAPDKKQELLHGAIRYADTYSMLKGDHALQDKIKDLIVSSAHTTVKEDKALVDEFQKAARERSYLKPFGARYMERVQDLTDAVIDKAIDPATKSVDRGNLLDTTINIAKAYSKASGNKIFEQNIQHSILSLPPANISGDDAIIKAFQDAMLHDNRLAMEFLVKKVGTRIKPFVNSIVDKALEPGLAPDRKELYLVTAMNFAKTLGSMTNDQSFHRVIHRRVFTARLSAPVEPKAKDGVLIVDIPKATGTMKNVFSPDNIIIKAGDTVRWVNHDNVTHVIGSFDFISDGHFFAPSIGPYATYQYTFALPGEYYYICFIHNSMIGKITVLK